MLLSQIKQKLSCEVSSYRFDHCCAVADRSGELARIHGVDADRAYLAGLLHDCAKELKGDKIRKYLVACRDFMYSDDLESPQIWHAFVGAEVARVEYGVDDEEVLSAIRWHTTGMAGMTLLDLVVYCADGAVTRSHDRNSDREKMFDVCRDNLYAGALGFARFERENCKRMGVDFVTHGCEMIEWLEGKKD